MLFRSCAGVLGHLDQEFLVLLSEKRAKHFSRLMAGQAHVGPVHPTPSLGAAPGPPSATNLGPNQCASLTTSQPHLPPAGCRLPAGSGMGAGRLLKMGTAPAGGVGSPLSSPSSLGDCPPTPLLALCAQGSWTVLGVWLPICPSCVSAAVCLCSFPPVSS